MEPYYIPVRALAGTRVCVCVGVEGGGLKVPCVDGQGITADFMEATHGHTDPIGDTVSLLHL